MTIILAVLGGSVLVCSYGVLYLRVGSPSRWMSGGMINGMAHSMVVTDIRRPFRKMIWIHLSESTDDQICPVDRHRRR